MKNRSDFAPDTTPPRSIKEIIEQEISFTTYGNKTSEPQSIEELLKRIYSHIEKKALERFKSNELWAVKAWTYENILGEAIKEAVIADDTLLDDLVSPIGAWQKEHFDPLLNFRRKLTLSGKKQVTLKSA